MNDTNSKAAQVLTLFRQPVPTMSEAQVEEFYKRGFVLDDKRPEINLSTAIDTKPAGVEWTTLAEPGVRTINDVAGERYKVLWGPHVRYGHDVRAMSCCTALGCGSRRSRAGELGMRYTMLFLASNLKTVGHWHQSQRVCGIEPFRRPLQIDESRPDG